MGMPSILAKLRASRQARSQHTHSRISPHGVHLTHNYCKQGQVNFRQIFYLVLLLVLGIPLSARGDDPREQPENLDGSLFPSIVMESFIRRQDHKERPTTGAYQVSKPLPIIEDNQGSTLLPKARRESNSTHDIAKEGWILQSRNSAIACSASEKLGLPHHGFVAESPNVVCVPPILEWGHQPLFTSSQRSLTIVNTWNDSSFCVFQPNSTNSDFYTTGFRETILPPGGMMTIYVIFLPTVVDLVEGLLVVQTSAGRVSIHMQGISYLDDVPHERIYLCPLNQPFQPTLQLQVSKTLDKLLALGNDEALWQGGLTVNTIIPNQTSVLQASKLAFPVTQIGQKEMKWIQVRNPSDTPIFVQLLVSSVAERMSKEGEGMPVTHYNPKRLNSESQKCQDSSDIKSLKASQMQNPAFSTTGDAIVKAVLLPFSTDAIGPIIFHPHKQCAWSSNLIILNNLTGIEWMTVQGYGGSAGLTFFDGNDAVRTLELYLNSSFLPSFTQKTLKERIDKLFDDRGANDACHQRTSKEFLAKNTGNLPLKVDSLMLTGLNGGSHGFKIDSFHGFYLAPGQSAKLLVSYQPDFTNGITERDLQLVTSTGMLSVTLKANVPEKMFSFCQKALLLSKAKRLFLQICLVALFLVLFLFGKMLKQESAVESDANQWPSASNTSRFSQSSGQGSKHFQDNKRLSVHKRSSIYVSIDFGCTDDEGGQCGNFLSLTRALHIVHAAMTCIGSLKLLWIAQYRAKISTAREPVATVTRRNDANTKQQNNSSPNLINRMAGKRGNLSHSRSCNKPSSMMNAAAGNSPSRSKAYLSRKERTNSPMGFSRPLEKMEPLSPTAALSDKETDKVKRKRRKNSISPGLESGSHSRSHSPSSTPSSPLKQNVLCRPVRPLLSSSSTSKQCCTAAAVEDCFGMTAAKHTMAMPSDKNESNESQWHHRADDKHSDGPVAWGDHSLADITRETPNSIMRDGKASGTSELAKSRETNQLRRAEEGSGNTTRARAATLRASATFPGPSRRTSHEGMRVEEAGRRWMSESMSSPNLVSTSAVAPHARAPGTPLSACTAIRHQQQARRRRSGGSEEETPSAHHLHYASDHEEAVVLYDIWGDHFVEIGRGASSPDRNGMATVTTLSFLSGQQAPGFSIFSCPEPFLR